MYRDILEQATRNDIAATAAAHNELGRDYDGAVAESLIDRIGAEIDKRVDTRLAQGGAPLVNRSSPSWIWASVALALGSMALGVAASAILLKGANSNGGPGGHADMVVVMVWIVIAGINVAYAAAFAHHR